MHLPAHARAAVEHAAELDAVALVGTADWRPVGVLVVEEAGVGRGDVVAESVLTLEHALEVGALGCNSIDFVLN